MNLGEKIYTLRKKRGLSQEELANSIHVSRQAISKWEQNSVVIDTSNLIKICNFFNVTIEDMTNEAELENEPKDNKKVNKNKMMICGLILLCVLFISTYFIKIYDFKTNGVCFDNPLNYLFEFPLNILFFMAISLSLIGIVKLFY